MKITERYFYLALFSSFVMYLFFYQLTYKKFPTLLDDNLISIIEKHPNYVLDIVGDKKIYPGLSFAQKKELSSGLYQSPTTPTLNLLLGAERIPLLFENRQGGLVQYAFRKILYPLGPHWSIVSFHFLASLLALFFLGKILDLYWGKKVAILGMLFLAMDATHLSSFSYALTEYSLHLFMLAAFTFFSYLKRAPQKIWPAVLGSLSLSAGLYIKITVLWYAPFFLVCFYRQFLGEQKKWIWPIFLMAGLGLFYLMDFSLFKGELNQSYHPYLAHNPLRELFNLIAHKTHFLSYIIEPDFIFNGRSWREFLSVTPWGMANVILFLSPLLFFPTRKKYVPLYIGFFSYFFCMWLSLPKSLKYMEYLFPLNVFFNTLLALSFWDQSSWLQHRKKQIALFVFICAVQLTLTAQWISSYRRQGPVSFLDLHLQEKVAQDLLAERIFHPYTVNIMDVGRLEFLSQNALTPDHLWPFLWKKNFPKIPDLLSFLGEGTMILTMDWNHRWMMASWGEVDVALLKEEAKKKSIEIYAEKIYQARGIERIYRFSFRRRSS